MWENYKIIEKFWKITYSEKNFHQGYYKKFWYSSNWFERPTCNYFDSPTEFIFRSISTQKEQENRNNVNLMLYW